MSENAGGFLHTFGNSQAAINLTSNILDKEEYKQYKRKVCRLLSKQFQIFNALMVVSDISIRRASLRMWHENFIRLTESLPTIVRTHTHCVETGLYRQLIKLKA